MEHLVESHLGGYYMSDREPDEIEEICEQCGDFDRVLVSWNKDTKMETLIEFFGKIKQDINEIEEELLNNVSKEDIIEDLKWSYYEDRYMINILLEQELISKEEEILLLKEINISEKKQFELLKSIYYPNGYVRVRNK